MIGYEVDGDGIAVLTWDLPGRSMNVLNAKSLEAFSGAVRRAVADDQVKGIVITSGKDAFIAGADLEMILAMPTDDAEALMSWLGGLQGRFRELERCGKPVAAAINGTALGGGLELSLSCHYRVAADRDDAQLGQPEVKIGLLPGAGGTQKIPRLIGARAALPLLLEGKSLTPRAAAAMGIIHKAVPAPELLAEAKRWILEDGDPVAPWDKKGFRVPDGGVQSPKGYETFVAGNAMLRDKTMGNYEAPRAIMSCVYEGLQLPLDLGLKIERRYFAQLLLGDQAKNMIRTLFFAMGAARKLHARPKDVERATYHRIGVLGAGMMGAGIAHAAAEAGLEVVLIDRSQELADQGRAEVEALLAKGVKRRKLTAEAREAALAKLEATTDFAALAGAELVIEAVFEERAVKAEVTQLAAAQVPDAIFASNTSTLPISGLADAWPSADRFIGLHFFSPVHRMPLVEVIKGAETSNATLAKSLDLVKRIGKTPIVVNDSRGFFTSRVFGTFVNEGLEMLRQGVRPALIENAGRMAGMPVGPLAIADEVSIELMHAVRQATKADLGEAYRPGAADAIAARFVEDLGRPGRKGGKGFYDYPEDGAKRLWPGLGQIFPVSVDQPPLDELTRRLLYIQSLETARCLEEGVLESASDADVGSILGIGFPPFTGGAISLIDTVGVAEFVTRCERLAARHGERFAPCRLLRDMAAKGERFHPLEAKAPVAA